MAEAAPDADANKRIQKELGAVEVGKYDPTPPCSEKSFEELNLPYNLLRALHSMGFHKQSKIGKEVLFLLLANRLQNLIVQSPSGTGKTVAFVLAMLTRVDPSRQYPQVLCLLPTKELAEQTGMVLQQMAQHSPDIRVKLAVFGSSRSTITEHILIGTADTIHDWAVKHCVFDPTLINMFVLNKGDVMIDTQGQHDKTIRLHKLLRRDCQCVFGCATYNDEVMVFANKISINPNIISMRYYNVKQYYAFALCRQEKYTALTNVLGVLTIGQCIIFCNARSAIWLARWLNYDHYAVALLTDNSMTVTQRNEILKSFREGMARILITTKFYATDIDVDQVTLVINYDISVNEPDWETYHHRIERSGRPGKPGLAINFIDSRESYIHLVFIQSHFMRSINTLDINDPDEIEKIQN